MQPEKRRCLNRLPWFLLSGIPHDKVAVMAQTEIDWFKLNIAEESLAIRNLSDESIAAYVRLRIEFFSKGKLPTSDDAIKQLAKLEKPRQWLKVRDELLRDVFQDGWHRPKWDNALKDAEARLADSRRKTEPARAARAANRQPAPSPIPEIDPDYEPIPF
jgi:hypothetical protein